MAISADAIIQGVLIGSIVGCIAALGAGYITGKIHDVRIAEIKESIKRLEEEIKTVRKRLHDWAGDIGWVNLQRRYNGKGKRTYDNNDNEDIRGSGRDHSNKRDHDGNR